MGSRGSVGYGRGHEEKGLGHGNVHLVIMLGPRDVR